MEQEKVQTDIRESINVIWLELKREITMKELTIEEKAKRYDEAIEKAKSKVKNDKDHVLYEDDILDIFLSSNLSHSISFPNAISISSLLL